MTMSAGLFALNRKPHLYEPKAGGTLPYGSASERDRGKRACCILRAPNQDRCRHSSIIRLDCSGAQLRNQYVLCTVCRLALIAIHSRHSQSERASITFADL